MIKIGNNTTIDKTCILKGDVIIGDNCKIGPYNIIENSTIQNNVIIHHSFIIDSFIDSNTTIGPYAHIRKKSYIGQNCRVGNFVEIKNSTLGSKVKCAHHSYLGDSIIGYNVNIGNGVVTANYDGEMKHKTIIRDNCFIGCKTILIAPVVIEENCYIAAGSVVNKNIDKDSFVISRSPLIIKKNRNI
jgi:bifunctional UDP-N-acetylglucosamine pyrophosphorylase/glucosamine-1-phosphate N-acetyltransferase